MIPRDYEWLHKHNCSVSFNHKENVIKKTHLLELGWSPKTNPIAGCNHPYQLLERGRGEKPSISQRFLALHHQNLSLFTSSIAWSWVKPGQNSFSSNGGKDNKAASTGMFSNGVFDMQDPEFLKHSLLWCVSAFCQVFRAANPVLSVVGAVMSQGLCKKGTAREMWGQSWEMERAGPCSAAGTVSRAQTTRAEM